MDGIHLVVFCAVDYQHLLDDCIQSARKNIQDTILSITAISNAPLQTEYNVILDKELWNKIDPAFMYNNLYKHNWVKQQILKLHLDLLFVGKILVCDVEVRFNSHIKWCEGQRCNIYSTPAPLFDSADFVSNVLDIKPTTGFLTEATLFSSDLLADLRTLVENKFNTDCLRAYGNLVYDDFTSDTPLLKVFMSEYELYNNFVVLHHPDRILNIIKHNTDYYYSVQHELQTKDNDTDTQWLNFYDQIKDPSWPECHSAKDFRLLPEHIQKECITVHGYVPND